MKDFLPTHVSLLTPPGRSAVAVLAVLGPQAMRVVNSQFCPAWRPERPNRDQAAGDGPLGDQGLGRILFGRWGGRQGEEVVVCRRPFRYPESHSARAQSTEPQSIGAPCSPVPYVEVHCHGGRQAVDRILDTLIAQGCQALPWQALARQQAGDLLQAEARIGLAAALTQRTASILLDQYQGALRREIVTLKGEMVACRDQPASHPGTAGRRIDKLLARTGIGNHLTWPWQVLVAGRPNVGKSSLINALLGYQRAIVYNQPGTTRDILSATTAMRGWPVQLSDTAGMHETSDPLEQQGIQLAQQQLSQTDLLVWVLDAVLLAKAAAEGSHEEVLRIARQEWVGMQREFPAAMPVLVVLNKIDLVGRNSAWQMEVPWAEQQVRSVEKDASCVDLDPIGVDFPRVLRTSATTGAGVQSLLETIATCLAPCAPPPGAAVPFNDRQQQLLQHAGDRLRQANVRQAIATLDALLGYR